MASSDLLRGAWARYVVVVVGLAAAVLVCSIALWPTGCGVGRRPASALLETSAPPDPASLAGCYALTVGAWNPVLDLGGDEAVIEVPPRMELTLEERGGELVMRPTSGAPGGQYGRSYWRVLSSRTLLLVWSNGHGGVTAKLRLIGDGPFRGRAKTFWDFPRRSQVTRVRAARTACVASRVPTSPAARGRRRPDALRAAQR